MNLGMNTNFAYSSSFAPVQKEDKPNPYCCEERPTTIDLETGERVYEDKFPVDDSIVCYLA